MKTDYLPALSRLRSAMDAAGADLLLIDHGELLAWLTGYTVSETRYRACLVPASGKPWMVLRELDEPPCREISGLQQIEAFRDDQDPWQAVAQSVEARGLAQARIGFDPSSYGMTLQSWQRLTALLPDAQWLPLDGISDTLRQVKFPHELAALNQAAAIADSAMQQIGTQVAAGWRVRDVAALAAQVFLQQGADTGETGPIVCARGDHGFLHASGHDHPLAHGDVLHVELIPKVNHYSARVMRSFVLGGASTQQQWVAQQLVALQDAQLAAMRPGALASEVDAMVRSGVLRAGLRDRYDNVSGYALGLYTRTPRPSDFSHCFHPGADWRLAENMVFHMYVSAQSLAFSETVVVTPQGGKRLSSLPRQLVEI